MKSFINFLVEVTDHDRLADKAEEDRLSSTANDLDNPAHAPAIKKIAADLQNKHGIIWPSEHSIDVHNVEVQDHTYTAAHGFHEAEIDTPDIEKMSHHERILRKMHTPEPEGSIEDHASDLGIDPDHVKYQNPDDHMDTDGLPRFHLGHSYMTRGSVAQNNIYKKTGERKNTDIVHYHPHVLKHLETGLHIGALVPTHINDKLKSQTGKEIPGFRASPIIGNYANREMFNDVHDIQVNYNTGEDGNV
jgi:hypothetical protein